MIRELTQVQTIVIQQEDVVDIPTMLRILADYIQACNGTLLSVVYHNEEDGGYRESLVAHIECPWQS